MKPENKIDVTVIMPALNEEGNIISAIDSTLKAFENFGITGEIIVINDGSTDKTQELVENKIKNDSRVRLIRHLAPLGIGACFWDGVDNARGIAVVLLPGDNENIPDEILRYYKLLEDVDIVIPFVFNKEVRSHFRNLLSYIYRSIINLTFFVNFNYTNGTVLYRRSILKELNFRSNGFFFQTDILIRLVKKGYLFAEVPYKLGKRKEGKSKALSFKSLIQVAKGYLQLVKSIYLNTIKKNNAEFAKDSSTLSRTK